MHFPEASYNVTSVAVIHCVNRLFFSDSALLGTIRHKAHSQAEPYIVAGRTAADLHARESKLRHD